MKLDRKLGRAMAILDAAQDATGRELTMMELAVLVGRTPGGMFSRDLAYARHLALDSGERITECYWSKARGCCVLIHLLPGQENGMGVYGLLPHGARVATMAGTLQRHAQWEATNAESVVDRQLASVAEHMGAGVSQFGQAFAELADLTRKLKEPATT